MSVLDWRVALLLGLGLGGAAAWQWQANSYGAQLSAQASAYGREREAAALAVIDWQQAEQTRRRDLESRLQASDQTHQKEMTNVQQAQARLRDRLATADLRLSVLLAAPASGGGLPATTSSSGVVHGATRAQLDPAHAQRIVGITDDGDQGLIALQACQAYVRGIAR
ncbi:lysis system i-spanin subunit Rz [Pseudomonas sp. Marseille-P9899]|uniref:lysis system i-spanin subunit Rz n=1 Tax=Pseudomonas sp. Marseille-P9899 TaxID=2730401 RepID=UPI00158A6B3F|nr:lysis system i-spanin subunit Rz [Pseudomonas sp. Marseille-P9899]